MHGCKEDKTQLQYDELAHFINNLPEKKGALISVLHKAQSIFGYLPSEVQEFVAGKLKIPASKVFGVVEFYSFFTMEINPTPLMLGMTRSVIRQWK